MILIRKRVPPLVVKRNPPTGKANQGINLVIFTLSVNRFKNLKIQKMLLLDHVRLVQRTMFSGL